jgi:hypothetical protein
MITAEEKVGTTFMITLVREARQDKIQDLPDFTGEDKDDVLGNRNRRFGE